MNPFKRFRDGYRLGKEKAVCEEIYTCLAVDVGNGHNSNFEIMKELYEWDCDNEPSGIFGRLGFGIGYYPVAYKIYRPELKKKSAGGIFTS